MARAGRRQILDDAGGDGRQALRRLLRPQVAVAVRRSRSGPAPKGIPGSPLARRAPLGIGEIEQRAIHAAGVDLAPPRAVQAPDRRNRCPGLGRRQAGDLVAQGRAAHVLEQEHETVVAHVEVGVEQAGRADRRVLRELRIEGHLARVEGEHGRRRGLDRIRRRELADDARGRPGPALS